MQKAEFPVTFFATFSHIKQSLERIFNKINQGKRTTQQMATNSAAENEKNVEQF
jgi:hypothetical protein